jgi:hypothetical protein
MKRMNRSGCLTARPEPYNPFHGFQPSHLGVLPVFPSAAVDYARLNRQNGSNVFRRYAEKNVRAPANEIERCPGQRVFAANFPTIEASKYAN